MQIGGRREYIDDRRRPMYYGVLYKQTDDHNYPKRTGKKIATGYPIFAFDYVNFRYNCRNIARSLGYEMANVYKAELHNKQVDSAMRVVSEEDFEDCLKSKLDQSFKRLSQP